MIGKKIQNNITNQNRSKGRFGHFGKYTYALTF
ncbi:hypothetical protein KUCAC02_005467 [Chaenocephalus aceratus]|uniref:Uncharacterized protein n=1 Tax=Chaenocephalus aceratus TaxID=36190 RepID=A0ACB9WQE4_CHAAC|nr:hypothetical protein KUCAC02_005467 [Chaenocephalus aceratus]